VAAGIDPIHFGVILVVNLMIHGLTPPLGMLIFVVSGVTRTPAHSALSGRRALSRRASRFPGDPLRLGGPFLTHLVMGTSDMGNLNRRTLLKTAAATGLAFAAPAYIRAASASATTITVALALG
jgi:hypothetical protein